MVSVNLLSHCEDVLNGHLWTFCSLADIFELGACSVRCRQVLQQGCQAVRVCIVPSGRKDFHASTVVDAWYGTHFECDKDRSHSFLTQGWSQQSLTAKIALDKDAWTACSIAFLKGAVEEFIREARKCLRCILWLVVDVRVERILQMRVPAASARDAGLAIGKLCDSVTLGLASWEERCIDKDWMGNCLSWWWGISNTLDDDFATDLVVERSVDIQEVYPTFHFEDVNGQLLFGKDRLGPMREMFQVLPRIEGIFEYKITPTDLLSISTAAKQALSRLGCLSIDGSTAVPAEVNWPLLGPFPVVNDLTVEIKDFYCGSDAWPPSRGCRCRGRCTAEHAKALAKFLAAQFPAVRRISFFFQFPYGDPVPYPEPSVPAMMRTLISDFEARLGRSVSTNVGVLIWQLDLTSLDHVELLCQPGERREQLLAAWSSDETPLRGGYHR